MSLVPSLLQAIVHLDGEALVMHAGDKPYVVSPSGQVDLATRGLALDAINGIVNQLLPSELQHALDEFGAVQYELPSRPEFPGEHFTIVAARGGDDVWVEVRRRKVPDEDRIPEEFFAPPQEAARAQPYPVYAASGSRDLDPSVEPLPDSLELEPEPARAPVEPAAVVVEFKPAASELITPPATGPLIAETAAVVEEPLMTELAASMDEPVCVIDEPEAAPEVDEPVLVLEEFQLVAEDPVPPFEEPVPMYEELEIVEPDPMIEQPMLVLEEAGADDEQPEQPEVAPPLAASVPLRPVVSEPPPALHAPAPPIAIVAPPIAAAAPPPVAQPRAIAEPPAPVVEAPAPVMVEPPAPAVTAPPAAAVVPQTPAMIAPPPPPAVVEPPAPAIVAAPAAATVEQPRRAVVEPKTTAKAGPDPAMAPPPPAMVAPPSAPATVAPPAAPSPASFTPQPAVVLPLSRNPIRSEGPLPSIGDPTMSGLDRLLRLSAARGASTLYLSSQSRPSVRVDSELQTLEGEPILTSRDVESLLLTLMPERSHEALRTGAATEWILDIEDVGRVRCMSFRDHLGPGGVFRLMPTRSVSADQLALPRAVQALAIETEGLVLAAGPRSSGKRTLMSAFVDLINRTRRDHVITIEREINIFHERGSSFISQREVRGSDDEMLAAARAALREDPDVLIIEELRTAGLMSVALDAAQSGHLVIGGFSAHTATAAVDRIIDLYGPEQRRQVQLSLADSLRGVVSQVLLRKNGGGRVAAREVLLNTPAVSSVIAEGKTSQLPMAIEGGRRYGMMPLNDGLVGLVQQGIVDGREAYRFASDRPGLLALLERQGLDTSFVEKLA